MNSKEFLKKALSYDRSEKQYKALAKRIVAKPKLLKLLHSVLGMSGEIGEATDSVKKSLMYGKDLDVQNLKEECGDILWYMSLMIDAIDSSFEEVMKMNDDKLSVRYPNGFTEKHARLRLDKKPRVPKKGAGRRLAENLKRLGEQAPPSSMLLVLGVPGGKRGKN